LVVTINELLAKNDTVNADERGDFDDWIELYNPSDELVDLSGFGLSDDSAEPRKHVFEEGTQLQPGAFLLIWADDDESQGPLHTTFKLSADGEEVVLIDVDGALVDRIAFGPQLADVSEGRTPDGADRWGRLLTPTPGAANAAPTDAGPVSVDAGIAPRISEVSPEPGAPARDQGDVLVDAPWVELHNPHDVSVALAGLALSTNAFAPQWTVPDAMPALVAGGYALFFLDGTDTPPDHAGISFTANAELALFDSAGVRRDLVVVSATPVGRTRGRVDDDTMVVTEATPGEANVAVVDAGPGDAGADDAGASDSGASDGGADAGYDAGLDAWLDAGEAG
jgi:hypothetical protein